VAVEVVGLQVQEHCDAGPELLDVLELEARELADDPLPAVDLAVEIAERAADVSRDGSAQHDSEELARRRLPVRAGDAEDRVVEQPRAQLDLAPDGNTTLSSGRDERRVGRYPWALDQDVHSLQQRVLVCPQPNFDAGRREPPHIHVLVLVDGEDALATPGKRQRCRLPRAREPEDERVHVWKRSGRKPRRYW
jgi:hypothetical protein